MKLINKNIINFFKTFKMIFYLNKRYASKYNLMFIFHKSIVIRKFSFFYIINVDDDAVEEMFKKKF